MYISNLTKRLMRKHITLNNALFQGLPWNLKLPYTMLQNHMIMKKVLIVVFMYHWTTLSEFLNSMKHNSHNSQEKTPSFCLHALFYEPNFTKRVTMANMLILHILLKKIACDYITPSLKIANYILLAWELNSQKTICLTLHLKNYYIFFFWNLVPSF